MVKPVWFAEALVSFAAFFLVISHLSQRAVRRLVGYKGWTDLALHSMVLFLFFGTSTEGLIQAEAAAIMFSLWLRAYKWAFGYERFDYTKLRWQRYAGKFA